MISVPLENVENSVLLRLGEVLWLWEPCSGCKSAHSCLATSCPAQRLPRLQRYVQFYKAVVSMYLDDCPSTDRTFKTHEDLFQAITLLRKNPNITRAYFCEAIQRPESGIQTSRAELLNAVTLAVKVMLMIDCSPLYHSSDRLEKGCFRVHWRDDVTFSKYLRDLFPTQSHPILSSAGNESAVDMKCDLRARKLRKRLGVTFRPTHDIQNHLRLDRRQNVLEIYHHTAFLKEWLRMSRVVPETQNPSGSRTLEPLPRQLLLETLDSIQSILFPLSEPKSKRFLHSMIRKSSFDPDIANFEFTSIRNAGEDNIQFVFLADRLSELYNELYNPRPRGWLERQVQRKSGTRYLMMATLIGVLFAVLLGMASLAVSSYQTWIAYQAWQHPVPLHNS